MTAQSERIGPLGLLTRAENNLFTWTNEVEASLDGLEALLVWDHGGLPTAKQAIRAGPLTSIYGIEVNSRHHHGTMSNFGDANVAG